MKLTDDSTRAFRELWKNDPLRAAQWVSNVAAHAHVETPAVKELREVLGATKFDLGALKRLVEQHPELRQPLGAVQASRAATLGWSEHAHLEAPTYTGTVQVKDDQVNLSTPMGELTLATAPAQWNAKWAAEVGAFNGMVVTVRGWPDKTGSALAVESFGPGSGQGHVQGRVTRTPDGAVAIQERPDKLVRITDTKLAAHFEKFMRVAFILPGEAKATPNAKGGLDWRYDESPDGYYMLTKLNPGDDALYDADTPFEKTHVQAAHGHFPVDKLGHRVFVFGSITDEHEGVVTDRVRKFTASWVSQPILPAWQKAAEAKGKALEVEKSPDDAVRALDPRVAVANPTGEFEPPLDHVTQALRLAKAWGVERKNGAQIRHSRTEKKAGTMQHYQVGTKLAEGPVDTQGRKHGKWSEFTQGSDGQREVALQGHYEHGVRQGIWVQLKDGKPANAWQFEHGKLKAAGHVDSELRPHGAWTLVGRDGLHDGGEGEYEHGVRVGDWWYYKPGTSEYERVEVYHANGALAAEGKTELTQVGAEKYDVRVGEWRLYDEQGKLIRTVHHTVDELLDGGTGETVGGKGP